ncbi:MAG: asparagine synthase-related protein [Rikenellaceae bacterium]
MFTANFKDTLLDLTHDESVIVSSYNNIEIAFSGKLYNKKELGFGCETSDPKAIIDLYQREGCSSFAKIDGSFTFIIKADSKTIIVRDHHGTNATIYYNKSSFASSLNLLLSTPNCSTTPNYKSIASFLSVGYIETPNSSFEDINKLAAGTMLTYSGGTIQTTNLFDTSSITPNFEKGDLESLSQEYGELHKKAIERRIGDSQNVGILLSGGYDSGCNLAALRKIYDGDIHSFSIGFKGDNWSELPLAKKMSDTFRTTHNQYEIDGSEIMALPSIIKELGDPFVEGGLMVNYAAMRMIGETKPDIILGGDGSDQYFGTSGREVAINHLASIYGMKPLLESANHILSQEKYDKNNKPYKIHFHLNKILNILQGDMFGLEPFQLKSLLQDKTLVPTLASPKIDNRSFEHLYTQHAYIADLEKTINQVILFKASRMADMFGNKMAFPYMDIYLYDFLKALPVSYKCKGDSPLDIARGRVTAKFLLKYHYKPMLPKEITEKKKQGGFAPMPIFFNDKVRRDKIADFLMSSSVTNDFLDRVSLEKFIHTYDSEATNSGNWFWYKQNKAIQYFNLLTIAIWWEIYVKGNSNITL